MELMQNVQALYAIMLVAGMLGTVSGVKTYARYQLRRLGSR